MVASIICKYQWPSPAHGYVCLPSFLQASLLEELLSLQQQLPPTLLQLPSAEEYHSAGAVLQFYQQQLSNALNDHAACAAALGSLQRIGNCLALLHMLSIQQAVLATPQFMQVIRVWGQGACRLNTSLTCVTATTHAHAHWST